ncbi:MAG: hypothetical protein AAF462_01070 [Thermodesulfobacteriota bacterium]
MAVNLDSFYKFLRLSLVLFFLSVSFSLASELQEEEIQMPEPQGACSADPCSPAEPCPSKDEKCYSTNGVFYCCVEPPFPGAISVGE